MVDSEDENESKNKSRTLFNSPLLQAGSKMGSIYFSQEIKRVRLLCSPHCQHYII